MINFCYYYLIGAYDTYYALYQVWMQGGHESKSLFLTKFYITLSVTTNEQ